jgi:3-methylcrotonyl-CoA carboxylase alpha subunit
MTIVLVDGPEVVIDDGGRRHRVFVTANGATRWAFWEGQVWEIAPAQPGRSRPRAGAHDLLAAPMPASVIRLPVAVGDRVAKGETVVLLEAMKMELPLRAARDGQVTAVNCREGELVQAGVTLIEIE